MSEDIVDIFPSIAGKFNRAVDLLRETSPVQKNAMRLVHGDFSMNQILVEGDKLHVIDLESLCMGDPHSDIATFLVRLDHPLPPLDKVLLRHSLARTKYFVPVCWSLNAFSGIRQSDMSKAHGVH